MSTYKNSTAAKTTVTRNTSELFDKVDGNLFEAIGLLTKRSNQISREMKEELTQKLEEFGGNNDIKPVLEAYQMGVKEHGEAAMRSRFERSAVRLLLNVFRVGLFENPYLDPEQTKAIVGKPEFMKAGYEAQLKSIVLIKNQNKTLKNKKQPQK